MAGRRPGRVILVGTAFPPDVPLRHPRVSAAAAAWQLDFARALAGEWSVDVTCLSYLPVDRGAPTASPVSLEPGIEVVPIARRFPGGAATYAAAATRAVLAVHGPVSCVFAYNPLPWTAPFARALAARTGAPFVMLVADLHLRDAHPVRLATQAAMLRLARRFLVLSPGALPHLPPGARATVFGGLADPAAAALPLPPIPKPRRFLYAGSRSRYEGLGTFLAAAERLAAEGAACEFHVTGRGEPVSVSSVLAPRLFDHGFLARGDLDRLLAAGAIAVNPRQAAMSPFNAPHKLLFYLSHGLPTVSTVTPGVADDLADTFVPTGESDAALAATMRATLAMGDAELLALAARGKARVAEARSPARLARRLREDLGLG